MEPQRIERPPDRPPKENAPTRRALQDFVLDADDKNYTPKAEQHRNTPRKWWRILAAFVDGRSLNRFQAATQLRDWCLNTTVSQLERRGVKILRQDETVPGAFGEVRCCRYRLAPESLERARELLGIAKDRKAAP